ncbi:MAG: tRNA uridine-5-carboxymethylaminomethyl(34) synthesis enzyme MnmG [Deltaproteobacteria bacterium]|jgi:tRNA uridine 5-carboxymethylaminomethyl modification enzyme|nr:tRNA uridine-5-carboxymethylaminomethyl(34) synthesis enzyme MnmG [Deltaproteobacteria bacterium]
METKKYHIIVVGGGHAGIEAAAAAAKMGLSVLLLTIDPQRIGEMPCNPSIGGIAKGHLVREIDALGGMMGLAADRTAIQYRRLNTRKGPAVRATRVQTDKAKYTEYMISELNKIAGLTIKAGEAKEIIADDEGFSGVRTSNDTIYKGKACVITSGTYLNGLLHTGKTITPGGIYGQPPSSGLSDSLSSHGISLGRLKTGTPARLLAQSIDFSRCQLQPGDPKVKQFSFFGPRSRLQQIPCYLTWTNQNTNRVISSNFDIAPLFNGQINGMGPRYCPSIEDKVFKFPQRNRHHIFLEPEGLDSDWIYPNGISTSLPPEVQKEFLHTIAGLEKCKIARYGYAVEYDYADPRELEISLQSKVLPGLYFAGQINGTSGYEEAAGQGLIAGINAVLRIRGQQPLIIPRDKGYIGVMIDDLTTKGIEEPYRLFTSRAEHRLMLREDNADERLTTIGRELGLIGDEFWKIFQERQLMARREKKYIMTTSLDYAETVELASELGLKKPSAPMNLQDFLKRPHVSWENLVEKGYGNSELPVWTGERIESEIKYEGYIQRQAKQIEKLKKLAQIKIPKEFSFTDIPGLRYEWIQKIEAKKPDNLKEVMDIPGMSPAAATVLRSYIKKFNRDKGVRENNS